VRKTETQGQEGKREKTIITQVGILEIRFPKLVLGRPIGYYSAEKSNEFTVQR